MSICSIQILDHMPLFSYLPYMQAKNYRKRLFGHTPFPAIELVIFIVCIVIYGISLLF